MTANMPGSMDGLKLAAYARSRFPPLLILIASGKRVPADLPERTIFLSEPYMSKHVIETIERSSAPHA